MLHMYRIHVQSLTLRFLSYYFSTVLLIPFMYTATRIQVVELYVTVGPIVFIGTASD